MFTPSTPRRRRMPALFLTTTLLGATTQAQQTDGWPDWLKDAMAKESPGLPTQTVTAAQGSYSFELTGKTTESGAFEGGWYFASDIDAGAPLECYLFDDNADLASLVVNLGELNIEASATANAGPVDNRSVYAIDAGAIDGAPFLALEWVYTIGEAPNAKVGFTKVRAAIQRDTVLACSHNYLGYRETFAAAFADFVREAVLPEETMPPYYEEVVLQRIGEQPVGITRVTYARDDEGDSLISTVSSALMPLGSTDVGTSDSSTRSWSTADGHVINIHVADAENGELVTNVKLGRNDAGDWLAAGTFKGKMIERILDGGVEPVSELGQAQRVKALFDGDESETAFPVWVASADPTRFLEGRLIRDDEPRAGKLVLGPLTFDARFDAQGALTSAAMNMGAISMTMDRVWVAGTL